MNTEVKVKQLNGTPCGALIGITNEEYIALVDIVADFATTDVKDNKQVYEETKNNVMRRFDVDEKRADEFINLVCYAVTIEALGDLSSATPIKQIAGFTPDVAIINTTRSAGAMSVIRSATEEAIGDKKQEYLEGIQKLADESGISLNLVETAAAQVPQLIVLLSLYPAFALGVIDDTFIMSKLMEYSNERTLNPLVTRNNMQTIFVIAAASEKIQEGRDTKDEE